MNNSDFYKLKYLKYKNKYISLKNEIVLEQKGGLPKPGGTVFYIPADYFTDDSVMLDGKLIFAEDKDKKIGIYRKTPSAFNGVTIHFKENLSYEDLCNMAVLVIPYEEDNVKISSTDKWYIPHGKNYERWIYSKLNIPVDDINYFGLYCIARDFLLINKKIIDEKLKGIVANLKDKVAKLKEKVGIEEQKVAKLEKKADIEKQKADIEKLKKVITKLEADIEKLEKKNIDELEVLCLHFDINRIKFNTLKSYEKLSTFIDYNESIKKYKNPSALNEAQEEEKTSRRYRDDAYMLYTAALKSFNELKQGKDIAKETLNQAEIAKNNAHKAYTTAEAIYQEKKNNIETLKKSAEFVSKNLSFLKKYKNELKWFWEGVNIDNLESTTVQ
jgi:hypothetical protein